MSFRTEHASMKRAEDMVKELQPAESNFLDVYTIKFDHQSAPIC